ncbi:AraC family transcriptional regulator [Vibrio sp. STUT-A11]|uniref:AraC family transcriptional regulator n=1 Tax=unclassified Vibrio TaxID=2614977 RepID=UPI0022326380|nr:AraC family transcriptional regulator [Vibrio sp. STUT-A11]
MKKLSEITIEELKEVYFGSIKYPINGTQGPRIQRGIQFFHLHSGQVTFEIEEFTLTLNAGDFCILLPGRHEFHQFSQTQESYHTWCQLDFIGNTDHLRLQLEPIPPVVEANSEIIRYMDLGLALTQSPELDTYDALLELGKSLLRYFINYSHRLSSTDHDQPPLPRSVLLACDYISQHIARPLTLPQIAEAAHVSVNHLIHLFRTHLSVTPMRYLWRLRCERASVILNNTNNIPIAHIAEQTGFSSPYHFSRVFKQNFGISPLQFRKQKHSHAKKV